MRWSILPPMLALAALASPALGQQVSGPARAGDGDSLSLTGVAVRLHGVDAPELRQTCQRGGKAWACGQDAAAKLASLVAGQQIFCDQRDTDDYGRIVATCRAGSIDLAAAMVDAGLAVALPHFTNAYVGNEARARDRGLGLWGSEFQQPSEYRANNPAQFRQRAPKSSPAAPLTAAPRPSGVYYSGCREVRAAGAAPLYRGQPGYRPEMDSDGDGIACEPYRRKP